MPSTLMRSSTPLLRRPVYSPQVALSRVSSGGECACGSGRVAMHPSHDLPHPTPTHQPHRRGTIALASALLSASLGGLFLVNSSAGMLIWRPSRSNTVIYGYTTHKPMDMVCGDTGGIHSSLITPAHLTSPYPISTKPITLGTHRSLFNEHVEHPLLADTHLPLQSSPQGS